MFTDAYGQQSCTAGRAAFITGQSPKRTGLLKIGLPGDPIGLQREGAYPVDGALACQNQRGSGIQEIISLEDLLPTLLAAAGEPDIKEKLLKGHQAGDKTFKIHLDGYNFLPYLTGEASEGPRKAFFYFVDDGTLGAVRYMDYKFHFTTQTHHGMGAWIYGQEARKAPLLINLRADPFEEAPEQSSAYDYWQLRRMYVFVPLKDLVGNFMATFKEFPPRQEAGSFTPRQ